MLDIELKNIEKEIAIAMSFESTNEKEEYTVNLKAKKKLLAYIIRKKNLLVEKKIDDDCFGRLLKSVLEIIQRNTGCAEDLEILEIILDELICLRVIDVDVYREVVDGSPVNRWC